MCCHAPSGQKVIFQRNQGTGREVSALRAGIQFANTSAAPRPAFSEPSWGFIYNSMPFGMNFEQTGPNSGVIRGYFFNPDAERGYPNDPEHLGEFPITVIVSDVMLLPLCVYVATLSPLMSLPEAEVQEN